MKYGRKISATTFYLSDQAKTGNFWYKFYGTSNDCKEIYLCDFLAFLCLFTV